MGLFSRRTSKAIALNRPLWRPFLSSHRRLSRYFFSTRTPFELLDSRLDLCGLLTAMNSRDTLLRLVQTEDRADQLARPNCAPARGDNLQHAIDGFIAPCGPSQIWRLPLSVITQAR